VSGPKRVWVWVLPGADLSGLGLCSDLRGLGLSYPDPSGVGSASELKEVRSVSGSKGVGTKCVRTKWVGSLVGPKRVRVWVRGHTQGGWVRVLTQDPLALGLDAEPRSMESCCKTQEYRVQT